MSLSETHERRIRDLEKENEDLRLRLLSAAGDDLCRLSQEEIKAYTSGAVQIPPRKEFIASCEQFHAQIAAGPGVMNNCLTMAQLIAENETLRKQTSEPTSEYLVQSLLNITAAGKAELFEKNFHRNSDGSILASVFCVAGPHAEELTGMVREWAHTKLMKRHT